MRRNITTQKSIGFLWPGHIDLKNYNSFKVYPLDVGLRMTECGYPMDFFEQLHTLPAGALCGKVIEQYIYQQLYAATSE